MKKEEVYQQIGLEIRRLREAAGLSQLELATRVGFKSATGISLIESADRRVSLSDLQEIAEALHVRIEHFFDGAVGKVTDLEATLRDDQNLTPREKDTLIAFYNYLKDRHSRG